MRIYIALIVVLVLYSSCSSSQVAYSMPRERTEQHQNYNTSQDLIDQFLHNQKYMFDETLRTVRLEGFYLGMSPFQVIEVAEDQNLVLDSNSSVEEYLRKAREKNISTTLRFVRPNTAFDRKYLIKLNIQFNVLTEIRIEKACWLPSQMEPLLEQDIEYLLEVFPFLEKGFDMGDTDHVYQYASYNDYVKAIEDFDDSLMGKQDPLNENGKTGLFSTRFEHSKGVLYTTLYDRTLWTYMIFSNKDEEYFPM